MVLDHVVQSGGIASGFLLSWNNPFLFWNLVFQTQFIKKSLKTFFKRRKPPNAPPPQNWFVQFSGSVFGDCNHLLHLVHKTHFLVFWAMLSFLGLPLSHCICCGLCSQFAPSVFDGAHLDKSAPVPIYGVWRTGFFLSVGRQWGLQSRPLIQGGSDYGNWNTSEPVCFIERFLTLAFLVWGFMIFPLIRKTPPYLSFPGITNSKEIANTHRHTEKFADAHRCTNTHNLRSSISTLSRNQKKLKLGEEVGDWFLKGD